MKKIALIVISVLAVSGCMTHKKPTPGKVIIPQNVKLSMRPLHNS